MNVEKEVTFSQLKAKFTKDLDYLSKMDPFLELSVGKNLKRTQVLPEAGKEAAWRDQISLSYFDQTHITFRAYDQDNTQNQIIGLGKIEIKSLRVPGGTIELQISSESGENMGVITGKYTIKNLAQSPLLLIKNIKMELLKESKIFLKCKPYLEATVDQITLATDPKEEVIGTTMSWNDTLRLKPKENSKIFFSLMDKTQNVQIFSYQSSIREYRLQNGSKKFNILDKSFNQLGHLIFDFETVNMVSKEESVKNQEKEKKSESQLITINIEKCQVNLPKEGLDVFYTFIIGTNRFETEVFSNSPQNPTFEVNKQLNAESKENKLFFVAKQKGVVENQILAYGSLSLENISNGQKNIILLSQGQQKQVGNSKLTITVKQSACKTLILENISLNASNDGDIIGTPQPYIKVRVGFCEARTETAKEMKTSFKKGVELKFGDEEIITFQIWDQDINADDLIYADSIPISQLKPPKGQFTVSLPRKEGSSEDKGKISFKYDLKGIVPDSPAKKMTAHKKVDTQRSQKEDSKKDLKSEVVKENENKSISQKQEENVANPVSSRQKSEAKLKSSRQIKKQTKKETTTVNEASSLVSERTKGDKHSSLNKDKSKETINLPSIIGSFHQVYGDRIFDKQSAATLQRTIVAYSMPKGNRFSNEPKYSGEPSYCLDSCFKPNPSKGVGFGFGKKKQFPEWMQRNMKQNPAPGSYFDSNYDLRSRGPTFGLGHKYYERVMIPREQKLQNQVSRKLSPIRDPINK